MKTMLAILILATAPALADDRVYPVGDWRGLGYQDGETWPMEVQIVYGGARVDYPSLPCGGVWVFDHDAAGLEAIENLTYGHELCIDALRVRISVSGQNRLDVRWFTSFGEEIAHAPLQRWAPEEATGAKESRKK